MQELPLDFDGHRFSTQSLLEANCIQVSSDIFLSEIVGQMPTELEHISWTSQGIYFTILCITPM